MPFKTIQKDHVNVHFSLKKYKKIWIGEISDEESEHPLIFEAETQNNVTRKIKLWLSEQILDNKVKDWIDLGYELEYDFPAFLHHPLEDKKEPVGFHVSPTLNRESILLHGLIPNHQENPIVRNASAVLDQIKPQTIPNFVCKEKAVYAHPTISNYEIGHGFENCDLYAVRFNPMYTWTGSLGLSGFAMFDEEGSEKENVKRAKKYGRLYWKHSYSISDYYQKTDAFKRSNQWYGIDEFLICHPVPKEEIDCLGSWDENGIFIPTSLFFNYTRQLTEKDFYEQLQKIRIKI